MMNALAAAQRYSSLSEQTRSTKDLEYDVVLKVTRELSKFTESKPHNFAKLVRALHQNERLWIEIGTQVADPANLLPQELRARLFYMAEFVAQHSHQIRQGNASVEALIEINVAILRGLKGKV